MLINTVKVLPVLLVETKFSSTLGSAHAFFLQHFKTSRFAQQLDGTGATDRQAHTWRQYRCQVSHSLTFTLLSQPPLISYPERGPQGPLSNQRLLASAVTALWVESQIITSPIGLDSDTKGRGGGYGGGFLFLSLLFSPLSPPRFFPPVLLLLHSSIFSPPFCLCLPFWLAPFLKKAPLADGELATQVTSLESTAG